MLKDMLSRYNPIYLWWKDLHKPTIYSVMLLVCIGLFAVFSASYQVSENLEVSNLYFFNKQLVFLFIATVAFVTISFLNLENVLKLAQVGFVCSVFGMFAVFAMSGKSVKGAERWLDLKFITIQPSEILKPFFIVVSAYIYYLFEKTRNFIYPILHGAIVFLIAFLLYLQPDFGMMLTYFFLTGILVLISNIRFRILLYIGLPFLVLAIIAIFSLSHVRGRILNFFQGNEMYQTKIAYNAIKNGGFLGQGLGNGKVAKHLPDSHNDFIFSRIGEELGAMFLVIILLTFAFLIISNLAYVRKEMSTYSELAFAQHPNLDKHQRSILVNSYIIILSIALIFFEVSVNVSVNLSLIPPKGMALPFISYGGSSMIAHGIILGFLCGANLKKYRFVSLNREHFVN